MISNPFFFLLLALQDRNNNNSSRSNLGLAETSLFLMPGLPPVARAVGVLNLGQKIEEQNIKLANDLQAALEKAGGKLDEKIVTASPELSGLINRLPLDKKTIIIKPAVGTGTKG